MKPLVAAVAVLVALAAGAPVRAQTPEVDALRARAEQGDAGAQADLGLMYASSRGALQDFAASRYQRTGSTSPGATRDFPHGLLTRRMHQGLCQTDSTDPTTTADI